MPFSTLRYAIVGCFLLILLVGAIEFFSQRECAIGKAGFTASYCPMWKAENQAIGRLIVDRIIDHNTDVVWQSALLQPPRNLSAERKRILVIGDSYVEGDGLSNVNTTFWRELQRELERRGYWDVDIIAAGRKGASTQAEAEWVEKRSLIERFKPDAVLLGFVTNDADVVDEKGKPRVRQATYSNPTACLPSVVTAVLQPIAPTFYGRILDRCTARLTASREAAGEAFSYGNWLRELYRPDNLSAYAPIVRRFVAEVRSKVPDFIVVTLVAHPIEIRGKPIYQDVATIFSDAGANWVDLAEPYRRRFANQEDRKPGMTANPANGHPGPILTRFYATEIADMLELQYPDVLGHRGTMPGNIKPHINDVVPASIDLKEDGSNTWSFRAIDRKGPALTWPISTKHAHLSFERPVAAEQFIFQSPSEIDITLYGHFIDEADGHVEISPQLIGRGRGQHITIEMPDLIRHRRLMSLRIAAEAIRPQQTIEWELHLVAGKIERENGKAHTYALQGIPYAGADSANPSRILLSLFENERQLAPGASAHADIRENGSGRYSHWEDTLYFSASDDSDPRTNGRIYRLVKFAPPPRISMTVQFGQPSVLP